MKVSQSPLSGVFIIEPKIFSDSRGFFFESFHLNRYSEFGIHKNFVQDNFSSSSIGVLRGLHYQLKKPQAKLISVTLGSVFDVVVDIRQGSPTFGKCFSIVLSAENKIQLYIPEGFAHGFYVLSDKVNFCYKCSEYYDPSDEKGIIWNDPALDINWPINSNFPLILSAKDEKYTTLKDMNSNLLPQFGNNN